MFLYAMYYYSLNYYYLLLFMSYMIFTQYLLKFGGRIVTMFFFLNVLFKFRGRYLFNLSKD